MSIRTQWVLTALITRMTKDSNQFAGCGTDVGHRCVGRRIEVLFELDDGAGVVWRVHHGI